MLKRTELKIEDIKQIDGLKLIRPKLFPDSRGYFVESYNEYELGILGFTENFKQVFLFCLKNFKLFCNDQSRRCLELDFLLYHYQLDITFFSFLHLRIIIPTRNLAFYVAYMHNPGWVSWYRL